MRRSLLIFFCLANSVANGQCLTTFSKLVPDQTKTFAEGFGSSFTVYPDILAVRAAFSDTLVTRGFCSIHTNRFGIMTLEIDNWF
jgi:hypothetical protein